MLAIINPRMPSRAAGPPHQAYHLDHQHTLLRTHRRSSNDLDSPSGQCKGGEARERGSGQGKEEDGFIIIELTTSCAASTSEALLLPY